jgi:hypothetical protein
MSEEVKMSVNEIVVANKEIAVSVGKTWKSGVSNKLKLASFVFEGFSNCWNVDPFLFRKESDGSIDGSAELRKVKELKARFVESLPFGKGVSEKFNRIGGTDWLYKIDKAILPNCYNTLDKLTNEVITNDEYVRDYIVERLSGDMRVGDIGKMIDAAKLEKMKEEEEKSRSKYSPNPETDLTKFEGKEVLEANDNDESSEGSDTETSESEKIRKVVAFKVLIDTDEVSSDNETYNRLFGLLEELGMIVSDNEDIASSEMVESVMKKMVKTLEKKAGDDARSGLRIAA